MKRISLTESERFEMMYGESACNVIVQGLGLPRDRELTPQEFSLLTARCCDEKLEFAVISYLQKKRNEHRMKLSAIHNKVTRSLRAVGA